MCIISRKNEVNELPFDNKEGYLQSITNVSTREEIKKLIDGKEDNIDFVEMGLRAAIRSGDL